MPRLYRDFPPKKQKILTNLAPYKKTPNFAEKKDTMQVLMDKNREKKRQEVIRRSLSSNEEAQRMLKNAGIITKQGNVSPIYRP